MPEWNYRQHKENVDRSTERVRNVSTGTDTLVASDAGRCVLYSSGCNITIPLDANVRYPIGGSTKFAGLSGSIVFNSTTGITFVASDGSSPGSDSYSGGTLTKLSTNTWLVEAKGTGI